MDISSLIVCPRCKATFNQKGDHSWHCASCGREVPLLDGRPVFAPMPENIQPFEKIERGPDRGTPWRQANWRFLESQVRPLPTEALILDVGAGHGDFAEIFQDRCYASLDVVPYPEVDLACDLTHEIPFRPASFDVLVLMNVLEHVYEFHKLLNALYVLLKPGGRLLVAVPFMIKIHQPPFDFYRYTHYTLEQMAAEHGFEVTLLEGYYDPIFFMGESTRNFRFWAFRPISRPRRWIGRVLLAGIELLVSGIRPLVGNGFVKSPESAQNPAAIGYHLVLTKPGP